MMESMRLTSRSEPGPEPGPSIDDDLDTHITGLLRYLGGALSAGAAESGGFWLQVSVPLTGLPVHAAAELDPGRERMPS
jgi:hypothetical protein